MFLWRRSLQKEKKDSVTLVVMDREKNPVRTLKSLPEPGLNRTVWRLDRKGVRVSFNERRPPARNRESGGGGLVLPGQYLLQISYQGDTATSVVQVEADPRVKYDLAGMKQKQEKSDLLLDRMSSLDRALSSLRDCKESYELVNKLAGNDLSEELKDAGETMKQEMERISRQLFINESVQGIYYPSDALYVKLRGSYGITGASRPLTDNQMQKLEQYLSLASEAIEMIDHFRENEWKNYRDLVHAEQISLIK